MNVSSLFSVGFEDLNLQCESYPTIVKYVCKNENCNVLSPTCNSELCYKCLGDLQYTRITNNVTISLEVIMYASIIVASISVTVSFILACRRTYKHFNKKIKTKPTNVTQINFTMPSLENKPQSFVPKLNATFSTPMKFNYRSQIKPI